MKAKDSLVLCILHLTGWGHERRICDEWWGGCNRSVNEDKVGDGRANLDCKGEVGRERYVLGENLGDLE